MTDPVLRKTLYLKAPRKMVWDYLTQPEHLAKWFHAPKSPLTEGQDYTCYGADSGKPVIWGTVRTATPPAVLEYTFSAGPMGDAVTIVRWSLRDVPGGTALSLEHTGLPQGAEAFDLALAFDEGWDKHLMRLRADLHGPD
ncbi:MAG: SRPBCC domain-containing protein [Pseudomonadota bacterium]